MGATGAASAADLASGGRAKALRSRSTRAFDAAASIGALVAVALLLAVGGLLATGHRVMIERSDSMSPVLVAGDLVVTRAIPPLEAAPGEIVTFRDPSRSGKSLTHRVLSRTPRGATVFFTTRGDRNGASENWLIDRDGEIGTLLTRVPRVGYIVAFLTLPAVRSAAVTVAALILGTVILRRIWSP